MRILLGAIFVALAVTASAAEERYPRYCCTDVGALGPYDNDSVPEGGSCYGTKGGRRYEGTACYGPEKKSKPKSRAKRDDFPKYCCTDVGRLGPYPNDSVREGESCYGTKNGKRYTGIACFGDENESDENEADESDDSEEEDADDSDAADEPQDWPRYCCTDAGKLGPYDNTSVPEGGSCYGTKNGRRYYGKACY